MGFMFQDALTSTNYPYLIPNTDPTRVVDLGYWPTDLQDFLDGACYVGEEPSLFHFVLKNNHFFLPPNVTIQQAEDLGIVSPLMILKRLDH